jgi:diguanylate cyclase (GGDEF)-like protein
MTYAMAKRAGRRLRGARSGAADPARSWALCLLGVLAAALVGGWARLEDSSPIVTASFVTWWMVAIAFLATDSIAVRLRFGREARAVTLSSVPMAIGLLVLPVDLLVAARVLAAFTGSLVRRRRSVAMFAWSMAEPALGVAVAAAVVHAAAPAAAELGPATWLLVIAATGACAVVSHLAHAVMAPTVPAHALRRERLEVFGFDVFATLVGTTVGILVTHAVADGAYPVAAVAAIPIGVLVMSLRSYTKSRQERDRLRALYEATRDLHASPQIEFSMRAAAGHARRIFEGEFCEIVLLLGEAQRAYRTIVGPGPEYETMVPTDLARWRMLWNQAAERGGPFVATRMPSLASSVAERRLPIESALVAPIVTDEEQTGIMVVANPPSEAGVLADVDLELLATLASQVAVAVENGRLEDSLAALTELKEELRHQALHDGLTGLANRTLFRERVSHAMQLSRRTGGQIAVLFIDLDDFKNVNDSLGHGAGDELLSEVADRLREHCRPEDTIARLGGDEFGILLEEVDGPSTATVIAQRVLDGLAQPVSIAGQEVRTTGSIGIAFGRYGDTANQVLRDADAAMYSVKRSGKGAFRLFESSMHAEVVAQLQLRADLEAAIRKQELRLAYQPIVDLGSGAIVGFEALVRWEHTLRGWLSPALFVPFAEQSGLIVDIGRWVLQDAVRQCAEWKAQYGEDLDPFKVTINLSAKQLEEPDLAATVAAALEAHRIDPALISLEITETTMMRVEPERLHELRNLGIGLAIDDFGTGYSSLASLHKLPVDILKIDRLFVMALTDEEDDSSPFVSTIVSLGRALGMQIIVEGIETMEQLDKIKELGCDLAQGYYFARPLRPKEAAKALRRQVETHRPAYDLEDLAYRTRKRRLASAG